MMFQIELMGTVLKEIITRLGREERGNAGRNGGNMGDIKSLYGPPELTECDVRRCREARRILGGAPCFEWGASDSATTLYETDVTTNGPLPKTMKLYHLAIGRSRGRLVTAHGTLRRMRWGF